MKVAVITAIGGWIGLTLWAAAGAPALAASHTSSVAQDSYIAQPQTGQPAGEIGHGYFTLKLAPGVAKTVTIVIKNTGLRPLTMHNYAVSGTQISAGGVGYSDWGTRLSNAGAWLHVQPANLTLAPGQAQRVVANIRMPQRIMAGQYVSGVALEDTRLENAGGNSMFRIKAHYRQVIAIVVDVPGPHRAALALGTVALNPLFKGSKAVVALRNTGNTLLKGKGSLEITNGHASTGQLPFTIDTILPSAIGEIPVYLPNITLAPGNYTVRLTVASPQLARRLSWQGLVAFSEQRQSAQQKPAPEIQLRPAQVPVQQQPLVVEQRQQVPMAVWGAGAVLLIVVGLGLGALVSRRVARPTG